MEALIYYIELTISSIVVVSGTMFFVCIVIPATREAACDFYLVLLKCVFLYLPIAISKLIIRLALAMPKVLLFAALLIQECWRGPQEDEYEYEELEDEQDRIDPYEHALEILGLNPGFSKAAFSSAYKTAMYKAHPDKGGSTEAAQLINEARAVIMRRHGWA